jgi:Transposase DDE domain group 1
VVKTGLQDYRLGVPCLSVALPRSIRSRNLTTLRAKLVKIGAKVEAHAKYVVFQLAEVAVPQQSFAGILERIARLCPAHASG